MMKSATAVPGYAAQVAVPHYSRVSHLSIIAATTCVFEHALGAL